MSASARSRPLALILSLVPGWGHVYWGRERRGLGLFTVFALAGFALLNGLYIYVGGGRSILIASSAVVLGSTLLGAWIDIVRETSPGRVKEATERREKALRAGMVAYLRGNLKEAAQLFHGCAVADPTDFEALFRLGVVLASEGDAKRARSCFRGVLKHDLEEKWRWEVETELERLEAPPAPAARVRPAGRERVVEAAKEAEGKAV